METLTMDEISLGLRAMPTADLRAHRMRATRLAGDRGVHHNIRIAALLAGSVIDHSIDGTATDITRPALTILRAERNDINTMIDNLENSTNA